MDCDKSMTKGMFHKTFTSFASTDHPDPIRKKACEFATKVLWEDDTEIINVTEGMAHWGCAVSVWYLAEREIE